MRPLSTPQIRIRRRPGAILLVWVVRLLAAWLMAAPLARAAGAQGAARFPDGDAVLFEPGGAYLIETVRLGAATLVGELGHALLAGALLAVGLLVPLMLLMVALCHGDKLRLGPWVAQALGHAPGFLLVGGLTLLVQGALVAIFGLSYSALRDPLHEALSAPRADLALWSLLGLGGLALVLAGIGQDLVRAALVRHGDGTRAALRRGLSTWRRRMLSALISWSIPALWSVAVVGAAALLTAEIHVERPGAWRPFTVLAIHQLAVVLVVALRASWLASALRLVGAR